MRVALPVPSVDQQGGIHMFRKSIAALVTLGTLSLGAVQSYAEETWGEKIENQADEAKKDTKKGVRKAKKGVRNATGNEDRGKDAKESLENAGDDVGTGAKKLKRKVD